MLYAVGVFYCFVVSITSVLVGLDVQQHGNDTPEGKG